MLSVWPLPKPSLPRATTRTLCALIDHRTWVSVTAIWMRRLVRGGLLAGHLRLESWSACTTTTVHAIALQPRRLYRGPCRTI